MLGCYLLVSFSVPERVIPSAVPLIFQSSNLVGRVAQVGRRTYGDGANKLTLARQVAICHGLSSARCSPGGGFRHPRICIPTLYHSSA